MAGVIGLDYATRLSERVIDWTSGTGTDSVEIPANAWVTGYSFTGGVSGATLIVTPAGGSAKNTITLGANEAMTIPIFDMGGMGGWTFAFDSAGKFYVEYYLPRS